MSSKEDDPNDYCLVEQLEDGESKKPQVKSRVLDELENVYELIQTWSKMKMGNSEPKLIFTKKDQCDEPDCVVNVRSIMFFRTMILWIFGLKGKNQAAVNEERKLKAGFW